MKLTDYAKKVGVHHRTARRWFHDGRIEGAYQLPTGTIVVPDEIFETNKKSSGKTIVYARVSSSDQRETNLEYQSRRLVNYCIANGWIVDKVVKEVGSGVNDKRKKLDSLLRSDENIARIVVEHKDRLTRFGFNYIEIIAEAKGFDIVVVNPAENDRDDLLEDLTSIITSFCARIYGQRRGKRKTEALTRELNHVEG